VRCFRCITLLVKVSWCVCEHVSRVAHNDAQRTASCRRKISKIGNCSDTGHMSFLIQYCYALNYLFFCDISKIIHKIENVYNIIKYRTIAGRICCVNLYNLYLTTSLIDIIIILWSSIPMRSNIVIESITTIIIVSTSVHVPKKTKVSRVIAVIVELYSNSGRAVVIIVVVVVVIVGRSK